MRTVMVVVDGMLSGKAKGVGRMQGGAEAFPECEVIN